MLNKRRMLLFILLIVVLMGGCTALPGEERSFAVVLCVDYVDENWLVIARIPAYQKEGGYTTVSAQHATLDATLAMLENISPLHMHFGQLRMVVIGPNVMEKGKIPEIMNTLAQRGDFRYDALLASTLDDIHMLCSQFEPVTGTRLSKSIDKQIETKVKQGILLNTTINEALRYGERQSLCLPLIQLSYQEGNQMIEFTNTVILDMMFTVKGRLSTSETMLLAMLRGHFKQGILQIDDNSFHVLSNHSSVKLRSNHVVDVTLDLECSDGIDLHQTEQLISVALHNLLNKLQMSNCDALGIARQAIKQYNTWQDWQASDWQSAYKQLTWNIQVNVR